MNELVYQIGSLVTVVGLLMEFAAFGGMSLKSIRRAAKLRLLMGLQAAGFVVFYVGVLVIVLARVYS